LDDCRIDATADRSIGQERRHWVLVLPCCAARGDRAHQGERSDSPAARTRVVLEL
jgi:hypothetical protein